MLTVKVRGADLAPRGQVDVFDKLVYSRIWLGVGGWQLTLPATAAAVVELLAEGAGLIVTDGPRTLFSGPVDVGAGNAPVAVREQVDSGDGKMVDVVTITGSCDTVWLADRLAHPAPESGNVATQAYDVRAGIASSVIRQYVDVNAGPGALAARRVPGLVVANDPVAGSHVSGAGRWQSLLVLVGELARQGGVTVNVLQAARQVVVSVTATVDRTDSVVFGVGLGNLRSARFETTRSEATALYVAGQGEGTARAVVSAVSPGRRIEQFVDRRDVDDAGELTVIAATTLAEKVGVASLSIEPVDTPTFRYGIDYDLGDIVGVIVDGVRHSERIVAVETTITPAGVFRALTVGQVAEVGAVGVWRNLRAQSARINQLERV